MEKRRQYTAEFKQEAVKLARENTLSAAGAMLKINAAMIGRWTREAEGAKAKSHRKTYQRRSPAERNHLDTVSFLKKAMKWHVREITEKGELSMAAIYTKLALDSLTGESE